MQITDLYQTKIEASNYNVDIDSTDTVITVSLIDFNGNPVTNKSVTLNVDKGYFNKKGNTSISGTTTKSITATTNTNGQISATYTASEWGLATFSTNITNTQVNISGWKQVAQDSTGEYTIKYNGTFCSLECRRATSWCDSTLREATNNFIPEKYRPWIARSTIDSNNNTLAVISALDGIIKIKSLTGATYEGSIYFDLIYIPVS